MLIGYTFAEKMGEEVSVRAIRTMYESRIISPYINTKVKFMNTYTSQKVTS